VRRLRAASGQQNTEAYERRSIEQRLTEDESDHTELGKQRARYGLEGRQCWRVTEDNQARDDGESRNRYDEAIDASPFSVDDRRGRERRRQKQVDSFAAGVFFFRPGEAGLNNERQGPNSELVTSGPCKYGLQSRADVIGARTQYRGDGRAQDVGDPERLQAQGAAIASPFAPEDRIAVERGDTERGWATAHRL
jgi:hypothetical protein